MNTGSIKLLSLTALLVCLIGNSYAQVKFSYGNDTLKGNVKAMTEYANAIDYTKKIVYSSDLIKRREIIKLYQDSNILKGKCIVEYDENARIVKISNYCNDDIPCNKVMYKYDATGRELERQNVRFSNNLCNELSDWYSEVITEWVTSMNDDSSTTVYKYQYNSIGRIIKTETVYTRYEEPDTSIEIVSYRYNIKGDTVGTTTNKIKRRSGDVDTTIETVDYKYNINDGRLVEVKKVSYPLWPPHTDTTIEITNYKYDVTGNIIEQNIYNNFQYASFQNWYSNGKEITTKTIYTYDGRNNLVDEKYYFEQNQYYPARSNNHPGKHVGSGTGYTYDSLNNRILYTGYQIYKNIDSSETKEEIKTRSYSNSRERKENKEYDSSGNLIKKTYGDIILFTRTIEYYED